jgi:hypothetical protein
MAEAYVDGHWFYAFGSDEHIEKAKSLASFELEERFATLHCLPVFDGQASETLPYVFEHSGKKVGSVYLRNAVSHSFAYIGIHQIDSTGAAKRLSPTRSHGMCHHRDLASAIEHAWGEWVERDLFFQHWYSTKPIFRTRLSIPKNISFIGLGGTTLEVWHLGNQENTYATAAVLQGESGFMIGLGSSISLQLSAKKAIKELALFQRYWAIFLAKEPANEVFRSFNDHLNWFWMRGGSSPFGPVGSEAEAPDQSLTRRDFWFAKLPQTSFVRGCTIETYHTKAIPQHSEMFGAMILTKDSQRKSLPRTLSGRHPFA